MKLKINVQTSRFLGIINANIKSDINIFHSGGTFVSNILKKKVINSLYNNKMSGVVIIDGVTTRINL